MERSYLNISPIARVEHPSEWKDVTSIYRPMQRSGFFFYRIEDLNREIVRAIIHWLPPPPHTHTLSTLRYGGLKKIVKGALGGGVFEKVPNKIDQAAICVPTEKEGDIPHYVEIAYLQDTCW